MSRPIGVSGAGETCLFVGVGAAVALALVHSLTMTAISRKTFSCGVRCMCARLDLLTATWNCSSGLLDIRNVVGLVFVVFGHGKHQTNGKRGGERNKNRQEERQKRGGERVNRGRLR